MILDECREKSRFISQGEVTIHGRRIPYNTICEDNFFLDEEGQAAGSVFTYAYFRSDVADPATRPVLFGYNGGPGCSSLWVHMGLLGPRRLRLEDELHLPSAPPFELEDNPHCLLDLCDLVMVDPVGTGLGRLFQEKAKEDFYDAHADVRALAAVIEQWLTRYGRRNSPVLLAGESYGTARSALLAGELLGAGPDKTEIMGISVSGIMLLGSAFMEELPVEKPALNLTAMAAANHYHNPQGKPDRDAFLEEAWGFAQGEYIAALFRGDELTQEERARTAGKLSYFTGLDEKYLLSRGLRVETRDFMHRLLEDRGLVVGYYDARYTWPEIPALKDANAIADDPAMGQYTPAFQAAFALMRRELGITFDRGSKGLSFPANEAWNRKCKTTPAQSLAGAMRRNPRLRVFFASGIYDLCTTAGNARYLAAHSNLDMSRVTRGEYPSGHMAYLGEDSARLLGADMRRFFSQALGLEG